MVERQRSESGNHKLQMAEQAKHQESIGERAAIQGQLFLEVLRKFGEAKLAVTGSSMLGSIWPGDVLEVRCCAAERDSAQGADSIRRGDIVLYARGGTIVAHRVVQLIAEPGRALLVTRGDGLLEPDPPVSPEELLGRVTTIVRGGRRIAPRLTRWGRVASWVFSHSDLCSRLALRVARARNQESGVRSQESE
jgi:hypothetical protein